jgi:hypothetical protein
MGGAHGLRALQIEGRSVQTALAATCRSLSPPAYHLLHLLARLAAGAELDIARIAAAAGIDEPTARTLVAELVAARVMRQAKTTQFTLLHLPRLMALQWSPEVPPPRSRLDGEMATLPLPSRPRRWVRPPPRRPVRPNTLGPVESHSAGPCVYGHAALAEDPP